VARHDSGGAGLVQHHDAGSGQRDAIIDSVVTKSISISSVKPSVPAGRRDDEPP